MKIFADTNILLDVFLERAPFYKNSALIWGIAECHYAEVSISAISFNNIHYLVRKYSGKESAQRAVEVINSTFSMVPLVQDIVGKAIMAKMSDFEDAIQFFSTLTIGADCIVTRNAKDYPADVLPVMTPETFLAQITGEGGHWHFLV